MSYLTHEIKADLQAIDDRRAAIAQAVSAGTLDTESADRELGYLASDALHLNGLLADRMMSR